MTTEAVKRQEELTRRQETVKLAAQKAETALDALKEHVAGFLGSSRRQGGQRVGRLLHADKSGQHIVLMTQEEFDKFEGRFRALEEKGFKINVKVLR